MDLIAYSFADEQFSVVYHVVTSLTYECTQPL